MKLRKENNFLETRIDKKEGTGKYFRTKTRMHAKTSSPSLRLFRKIKEDQLYSEEQNRRRGNSFTLTSNLGIYSKYL